MLIETLYQFDAAPHVQRLLCCRSLDLAMEVLSTAGEGWSLALMAIALAWKANPARRDAIRSGLRGLTTLAVTGLLVTACKWIFQAPRPLQVLGPERVRVLLEPLRHMSFPSGHSAAAAALAMWAAYEPSRGTRRWPWLLALLVGLSRVYVGAHWATDVLAGWFLGVATAAAVGRAWPRGAGGTAGTGSGVANAPAPADVLEGDSWR